MPRRTEENYSRLRYYSVLLDRDLKPGVWNNRQTDRQTCHVTPDACELMRASGNVLNGQFVRLFGGRQRGRWVTDAFGKQRVQVLYLAEGDKPTGDQLIATQQTDRRHSQGSCRLVHHSPLEIYVGSRLEALPH